MRIERVGTFHDQLGEGPLWDVALQMLFWVDSVGGTLNALDSAANRTVWQLPGMIGSLAVVDENRVIVALDTGIHLYHLGSRELTRIANPESADPRTRFNDGKTDRNGQFVTGTMGIKVRDKPLGALYRVNANLMIECLEPDVIVANGPCFSPDGSTLYFNDGRRRILAYDYNPDGPLTHKRLFFDAAAHDTGSDGATVDRDGRIWVALTGSGEIGCLGPDGRLLDRIPMPVKLPSSVMFGGPGLDELYVTSIHNSGNRTSDEPGAGGLYRITGLDAIGIAEPRFITGLPRLG